MNPIIPPTTPPPVTPKPVANIGSYKGVEITSGTDAEVKTQVDKINGITPVPPTTTPVSNPAPSSTTTTTPTTTSAPVVYDGITFNNSQDAMNYAQDSRVQKAQEFNNTITGIQNGAIPLSSGENAMIDALKQSYETVIQSQALQNKNSIGQSQIRGFQKGVAEYDPTFQAKTIGSIFTAGAAKITALQVEEAGAIAKLTQSLKEGHIAAVKEAYDAYTEANDKRVEQFKKTFEETQDAINKAAEANRISQIDQSISEIYDEGVTSPLAVIKRLKEMGVNATAEEVNKTLNIINPPQNLAGLSGDYRTFLALKEAGDPSVKNLNWMQYQRATTNATTKVTGNSSGVVGNISPITQSIIANPSLFDDLTPTVRGQVIAELQANGYNTTNLGVKSLSDSAIKAIADTQSALANLEALKQSISSNLQYIGPISGLQALNPYSEARKVQAEIDKVKQTVGKALEGGVLRKEDEEKYKKILSTITDTPDTALFKVDSLISILQRDIENYKLLQAGAGRSIDVTTPLVVKGEEVSTEDLRTKYDY